MKGPIQPVPGAIAGEDPPCAIRSVSGRSQPENEQRRLRITEAGNGSTPILLIAVGGSTLTRHLFSPVDEALTSTTVGDLAGELVETFGSGRLRCRRSHIGTVG
jgi:hypothetical protein